MQQTKQINKIIKKYTKKNFYLVSVNSLPHLLKYLIINLFYLIIFSLTLTLSFSFLVLKLIIKYYICFSSIFITSKFLIAFTNFNVIHNS